MAQIILSGDELIAFLKANGLVPDQIFDMEVDTEEIRVRVRTPLPILKSIRVGLRLAGFEEGQVVLQLVTNRLIDAFDWLVDRMLASLRPEEHGGRWEYPRLYVDVNKLLGRQIRGVEVTDVTFAEGHFHVTTVHSASAHPVSETTSVQKPSSCAPEPGGV